MGRLLEALSISPEPAEEQAKPIEEPSVAAKVELPPQITTPAVLDPLPEAEYSIEKNLKETDSIMEDINSMLADFDAELDDMF